MGRGEQREGTEDALDAQAVAELEEAVGDEIPVAKELAVRGDAKVQAGRLLFVAPAPRGPHHRGERVTTCDRGVQLGVVELRGKDPRPRPRRRWLARAVVVVVDQAIPVGLAHGGRDLVLHVGHEVGEGVQVVPDVSIGARPQANLRELDRPRAKDFGGEDVQLESLVVALHRPPAEVIVGPLDQVVEVAHHHPALIRGDPQACDRVGSERVAPPELDGGERVVPQPRLGAAAPGVLQRFELLAHRGGADLVQRLDPPVAAGGAFRSADRRVEDVVHPFLCLLEALGCLQPQGDQHGGVEVKLPVVRRARSPKTRSRCSAPRRLRLRSGGSDPSGAARSSGGTSQRRRPCPAAQTGQRRRGGAPG